MLTYFKKKQKKINNANFLPQGTIYSDVVESCWFKRKINRD